MITLSIKRFMFAGLLGAGLAVSPALAQDTAATTAHGTGGSGSMGNTTPDTGPAPVNNGSTTAMDSTTTTQHSAKSSTISKKGKKSKKGADAGTMETGSMDTGSGAGSTTTP